MTDSDDISTTVLKARIALLATAIGGPDYNSRLDPPPYKLGDDCLACLKDLKRWFRLVDENQNRWDVAMATAEYRILQDDLLPILIDWENKSYLAHKLNKQSVNKDYHDNVALLCVQLLVLMTWPLVLTDQSTAKQVVVYSELKKHQLVYKKHLLMMEKGKVLKAASRLALKIIQMDKIDRNPRDNVILRLILNLFRNIVAIEPGELNVTRRKQLSSKGINSVDMLPPNVSMDDISLNAVITAFHRNKVFGLILTLSSSLSSEFEQDYINLPLMELMFYLTKDIAPGTLCIEKHEKREKNKVSDTGAELLNLLNKENTLKKNVIKNTSSRHSRFGALLSIQTPDSGRLTISGGGQNLLDDTIALKKLDNGKKWNKRSMQARDDVVVEGLPNSLLNTVARTNLFQESTMLTFTKFIDAFISSSFNPLLYSVTNHFTTDHDQMSTLEQTEYLLFFAWFVKYQREKCIKDIAADITCVDHALRETSLILMSTLLRTGYERKNWAVAHAGMIAFNELLLLLSYMRDHENSEEIEFILTKIFSEERIQLLTSLPKSAFRHSLPYMKSCVELVHTILRMLEPYNNGESLMIAKKNRRRKSKKISETDIMEMMNSHGIGRDEALDIFNPSFQTTEFNFMKILRKYCVESVVDTYINYLQRFKELEEGEIKKSMVFLHRVFVQASEESMLFRIDLLVLLRDMLAPDGISRKARVRVHVEEFSNYFLHKLKKKLKHSPSWFVGVLFPLIYGSEVGYFQKYGEKKPRKADQYFAALPSTFKHIEDEEQLPHSVLNDMKYGILISTLIDDGKNELLDQLMAHLQLTLDHFRSWLTVNIQQERETQNPPDEIFKIVSDNELQPLLFDKDFRALLDIIGFHLPLHADDLCKLPGDIEISSLEESLELVKKYISTPFQTPNGLPSSSYLIRPRTNASVDEEEWQTGDANDHHSPDISSQSPRLFVVDDDLYFEELGNDMTDRVSGKRIERGLAKSKNKKKTKTGTSNKKRNNSTLPKHSIDEPVEKTKHRKNVLSKDFISDSENEEDYINPLFFENEMYMRWLLDKYRGQLPEDKYALFGKFSSERIANDGLIKNDYSALFGGSIPDLQVLQHSETSANLPDKTLLSLSRRVAAEMEKESEENRKGADNTDSEFENFGNRSPRKTFVEDGTSSPLGKKQVTDPSSFEEEDSEETDLPRKKRKVFFDYDEDSEEN
ncbi:related to Topoisomerase 1-associated factor 1 [Zygosaccharomyces bailii]|nr:related to Topoisomerase 1-associated factor 1 [Zygosaccharomyces bailii]